MKSFLFIAFLLSLCSFAAAEAVAERPSTRGNDALFARWLVGQGKWGVLTTLNATKPFGYVASYTDAGTGFPYFFLSTLDPAGSNAIRDPASCFTISEASIDGCANADPQSPFCSKIALSGELVALARRSKEEKKARKALFADHPQLAEFPRTNGSFAVYKLEIESIFLVNKPASAISVSVDKYLRLE